MERRTRCHDVDNIDYGGDELFSIMEVEKRGEYVDNEFELKQNDYKQKIIQLKSVSLPLCADFFKIPAKMKTGPEKWGQRCRRWETT